MEQPSKKRIPVEAEKLVRLLSYREAEVYFYTGCGYTPKRIAAIIGVSDKTVESYIERIRKKMGYKPRGDLQYAAVTFMRRAAKHGHWGPDKEVVGELLELWARAGA